MPQRSWLRTAALIANVGGAIGAIGFWIHATQHPPLLIIVLFVVWVLSPFALLGVAHARARGWTVEMQKALYYAALFVALGTLAIYTDDALHHRAAHRAFVYVLVPPVSWVVTVAAVSIGALRGRRGS